MDEKKNIGLLFDRIAWRYDRVNHLLSLNIDKCWRRKAVATLRPADTVLDVAIGTADLAIEIVRRHKARRVQGIDLSAEMMRVGQDKVRRRGMSEQIRFEQGSALELPYPPVCYDAVTCAYGIRNFSDLDRGLAEMCRVLRRDGQLVILEFSYPTNPLVRWGYNLFFTHIMPLVGRLVSHDAGAYLYFRQSVNDFVWGEDLCNRLRQAGFRQVHYRPLTFGITTLYTATK